MKYPEFIVAIRRKVLQDIPQLGLGQKGFVPVNLTQFLNLIQRGLIIGQREDLDESLHWGESFKGNRDYAQWLNYFTVESYGTPVYLPEVNGYLRSHEGNGESDLQGCGSICPGGHTDFIDVLTRYLANGAKSSVINPMATMLLNVTREAFEEMTWYVNGEKFQAYENEGTPAEKLIATEHSLANLASLHFEGLIFDASDNVGRLHLAVALRLRLRKGVTVGSREKGVDFIPPVALRDFASVYPGVELENWSKLFADHLNGLTPDYEIGEDLFNNLGWNAQ